MPIFHLQSSDAIQVLSGSARITDSQMIACMPSPSRCKQADALDKFWPLTHQHTLLIMLLSSFLCACLQERAYVTGLRAANMVIDHLGRGTHARILDTEADEPLLAFGKQLFKTVRAGMDRLGIPQPFL